MDNPSPSHYGPVRVKRLNEKSQLPQYAHANDACADIFACLEEDLALESGDVKLVGTGLSMDPGVDWEILIRSRSGLSSKGIVVANSPGTIDPDYRGEIKILMQNLGNTTFVVKHGMKIAQIAIRPIFRPAFEAVEELSDTVRGTGGFGSTGL